MSIPKIESGVPMPSRSEWAELLKTMKIGDSFEATVAEVSAARAQAFKVGITLQSRTVKPNRVRIWRTA